MNRPLPGVQEAWNLTPPGGLRAGRLQERAPLLFAVRRFMCEM